MHLVGLIYETKSLVSFTLTFRRVRKIAKIYLRVSFAMSGLLSFCLFVRVSFRPHGIAGLSLNWFS